MLGGLPNYQGARLRLGCTSTGRSLSESIFLEQSLQMDTQFGRLCTMH